MLAVVPSPETVKLESEQLHVMFCSSSETFALPVRDTIIPSVSPFFMEINGFTVESTRGCTETASEARTFTRIFVGYAAFGWEIVIVALPSFSGVIIA